MAQAELHIIFTISPVTKPTSHVVHMVHDSSLAISMFCIKVQHS